LRRKVCEQNHGARFVIRPGGDEKVADSRFLSGVLTGLEVKFLVSLLTTKPETKITHFLLAIFLLPTTISSATEKKY